MTDLHRILLALVESSIRIAPVMARVWQDWYQKQPKPRRKK